MQNSASYSIIQSDITKLKDVDVIVNAASETLFHGAGVCGAIHKAAGWELNDECQKYIKDNGRLRVSWILTTESYNLKKQGIKKIIHVVGPMYDKFNSKKSEDELEEAIKNVYNEVFNYLKLNSVAIPAISSGIFGFPKELCARVFKRTIPSNRDIRLCNQDEETCSIFNKVFADPKYEFSENFLQSDKNLNSNTTPCNSSQQEKIANLEAQIVRLIEIIKLQKQLLAYSKDKDMSQFNEPNSRINDEIHKQIEELEKLTVLSNIESAELKDLPDYKNMQSLQNSSHIRNEQYIAVPNKETHISAYQLQNTKMQQIESEKNDKNTEEQIMKLTQELNKQIKFNQECQQQIIDLQRKQTDLKEKNFDNLSLIFLQHIEIERLQHLRN